MGKTYTIKPAHVVTSIKQSHALKITFSCPVSNGYVLPRNVLTRVPRDGK
jgi:hypothetical protein